MVKIPSRNILLLGSQMRMGGAQRIMMDLGTSLHRQGHTVVLAFFYDKDNLHTDWQTKVDFPVINLRAWSSNKTWIFGLPRLASGWLRLIRILRSRRTDAILTFTHHSNLLGIPASWLAGVPVRVASHHGRILGFKTWQDRLHARMINSRLTNCLVVVSEETSRQAIDEGVNPEKIKIIPNGFSRTENSQRSQQEVLEEFAIPPDSHIVVSAGRLTEEKGHIHLVRAIPGLIQKVPNVVILIVGAGPLDKILQAEASELGISDQVRFTGFRSDVLDIIGAADLFVLPSNSEGLPLVLLESMGSGVAVISTIVGGVPEIVQEGVSGLLVPPGDSDALSKAMIELLTDDTKRKRIALTGQNTILDNYSLEAMADQYVRLLVRND